MDTVILILLLCIWCYAYSIHTRAVLDNDICIKVFHTCTVESKKQKQKENGESVQCFSQLISENETHTLLGWITHGVKLFSPLLLVILLIMSYWWWKPNVLCLGTMRDTRTKDEDDLKAASKGIWASWTPQQNHSLISSVLCCINAKEAPTEFGEHGNEQSWQPDISF